MSDTPNVPINPQSGETATLKFQETLASLSAPTIVTYAMIIANVAVFAVMVARGVSFMSPDSWEMLNWGANFGPKTMNGQWWRLVTCMFLHYGIVHLAVNMWVLWALSPLVEHLVGRVGFGIMYMVSGVSGSIASLAWNPLGISAGASGAVFGVAGALLGFVVLRHDTIPKDVRNRMLKSMAGFLVLNTIVGMSASQIDVAAHFGGFAGGLACGLILSQPLSTQMVARRKYRNGATVMAAVICLPLAVFALPTALPDVENEFRQLEDVEYRVYLAINELAELSETAQIDDAEYATRLEREVLPQWIAARQRIERLVHVEYVNQAVLSTMLAYLRVREESWQLMAEGLREQDVSKVEQAKEKSREADEMWKEQRSVNPE